MKSVLARQPDNTIQLQITVPWESVKQAKEKVVEETAQQANLPGFRKGKAPTKLVEENLDQQKVLDETFKKILPDAYIKAVEEHSLRPIMNPKIQIVNTMDGKDWQFTALTCEMPQIDLNGYKENIQKVTAKSKIVIPGKEEQKPNFDEVMKALLDSITVQIPRILIDQEVDRLLAHTLDEIKRIGLNLDQYLASTNRTPETLRAEYEKKATDDIKLEFTLQKIAENEKITVGQKEIEEAIQKAKDESERKHLEANRYLLASIIRQQKTLDFIKSL